MTLRSAFLIAVTAFLLVSAAAAEDITATLGIDYEGDGVVDVTAEETMAEGSTAYDLLDAAAEVEVEVMDWGVFVVGIDGVKGNWDENGTWWSFKVNDEMSEVGVGGYVLEDGDVVAMSFEGAPEGEMTVILEVDYEGDGVMDKTIYSEMEAGSTALDLLNETTEVVTVESGDEHGILVVGIDGVMSNYEEEGTWWMFMVNGTLAEVTPERFVLEQGQTVTMSMGGAEEAEAHGATA